MNTLRPDPTGARRTLLWLTLILAAGLAIRLWYLDSWLDAGRFWDERFSLDNVRQLHETGSLKPRNGYYPLLSYRPQALLLSASDGLHRLSGAAWLAVRDGESFTAHAYRLSRLVQAIWGIGALWLTFLIGRRLFSSTVGLVAATALAFSPGHIHASGVFKPDAPLVLAVLLAFYWSLAAARRPSPTSYGLAGAGVTLAMSTKLTGGLIALPLALVSLLRCRREPRRLLWLALAGGVALALFLLINPYWPAYFESLEKLTHEYKWRASAQRMTRWQAPMLTVQFLLRGLGALATAAAGITALILPLWLARRKLDPDQRPGVAMLLFLPPAWVAGYMTRTDQFKPNNFLPILPFVALLAAWGLVEAWRWLARRDRSPRGTLLVRATFLLLAALALVPQGITYVYRSLTPSAEDLVLRFADRQLTGSRNCQVIYERGPSPWPPWERAAAFQTCLLRPVDRLTDLEVEQLRLADGVLFRRERLVGTAAAHYLDAVAASDAGHTAAFWPIRFRIRGPGFVAALHPWRQREPEQTLALRIRDAGDFRLEADMPAQIGAGETLSFSIWLPRQALEATLPPPRLKTGGRVIELMFAGSLHRGFVYVSPRLVNRRPGPRVRINRRLLTHTGRDIRLTLWRWQREGAPGESRVARRAGTPRRLVE